MSRVAHLRSPGTLTVRPIQVAPTRQRDDPGAVSCIGRLMPGQDTRPQPGKTHPGNNRTRGAMTDELVGRPLDGGGRNSTPETVSMKEEMQGALEQAWAWIADDPDPTTREQLTALIAKVESGDPGALDELLESFAGTLEFGTAGLRGELAAGPNRMNRVNVIKAAAGLTAYLRRDIPHPIIVIGFDARHNSAVFAQDTAAVVTAAGGRALLMPRPIPTPVLAFAIRRLRADAGVQVTASHNPPKDNGYKVYLGDGCQIVPPADVDISSHIRAVKSASAVPLADAGWTVLGEEIIDEYVRVAAAVVGPGSSRDLKVVHTSMHGVGRDVLLRVFESAGFAAPVEVEQQAQPDPDFPTLPFPNPEEAGALDLALALAREVDPDLVLANDPDADRCAVCVKDWRSASDEDPAGWRMLRGDEVGVLIGAHLIARGVEASPDRSVFARSIVSSRLLGVMALSGGLGAVETLTGFKWIGRTPGLRFGYEEALGYCVDPSSVADKDGITAALLFAELAAGLRATGSSVVEMLDEIAATFGVYQTDALSVRTPSGVALRQLQERLREGLAVSLGGVAVERLEDLLDGHGGLPPTEGMRCLLADGTRIMVRPSGTEPKLKIYLEAVVPATAGVEEARAEADRRLRDVRSSLAELIREP